MANTNYILLIRKADFIDFFKNGKMNGNLCASEKFDGNIEKLATNAKLAQKVFKKANSFEYSIDYLLMTVNCASLKDLKIFEVQGIYALDDDSYRIGLDLNPSVVLQEPIWENYYHDFQINRCVDKANEGAGFLLELFGSSKKPALKNFKKDDIYNVFRSLYLEERPAGELPIWNYLMRYERHEAYPNDIRGFVLDALHVYANFSAKRERTRPVTLSNTGQNILSNKNKAIVDIIDEVYDAKFMKDMKAKKIDSNFMKIATLFLLLKDAFINGISDEEQYYNMSLDSFIQNLIKKYDEKILMPAVYLLGLSLGYDNVYKYMYKRGNLKILE